MLLSSDSEPEIFSFSEYLKGLEKDKQKMKEEDNGVKRERSADEQGRSPKKTKQ